jgi:peptidoglycan/LPS O-acetylase OafA/YrhL
MTAPRATGLMDAPDARPALPPRAHRSPSWRSDIQGLRALAVLLVVAFHAGLDLPGGYVGVDVFFVISGFVITTLLLAELSAGDRVRLRTFYARRARRLLPALAVTIVATVLVGMVLLSPLGPRRQTAATGAAASVFAANVQLAGATSGYFDVAPEANALLHTWSLSVEEQFYFAFPVLLMLAWRASRRRARPRAALAAWLGAGLLASFALSWWWTSVDASRAFYASPARAWEFAAGALLAVALPRLRHLGTSAVTALGLAGLAAIGYAAFRFGPTTAFPGSAAAIPVFGTAALIAAGSGAVPSIVSRGLGTRPLTWIGDRSYGWYLWHWPAIVFASATWSTEAGWVLPAVAVASLVPTCVSYRWLERPVRRSPRLVGGRVVALAATCILVPLAVSGLVWSKGNEVAASQTLKVSDQFGPHLDAVRGCNVGEVDATLANPNCNWKVPDARGRVVLVGDSNAGHLVEGLLAATRAQGYDLSVVTFDACPFAVLTFIDNHPANPMSGPACRRYVEEITERLTADRPSLVVIGSVADLYVADPGIEFGTADGTFQAADTPTKIELWNDGLTGVLRRLTVAGVPVALVHPVPHFIDWDPRRCGPGRLSRGDCGRVLTLDEAEALRSGVVAAENEAVADAPGARTVDLNPAICLPDRCATNDGGRWIYRDGVHLTVGASESLGPQFENVIEAVATPRP